MRSPSNQYWPALDGVRGFAILAVVLGHTALFFGPTGGEVGVTVFFVLSGFLITNILLNEQLESGSISFRRFYFRRLKRLVPALVVFLGGVGVFLLGWFSLDRIWAATWPPLFYVSNYVQIAGIDVSYNPHTWSLAVEEHFYLLWPAILFFLPATNLSRKLFIASSALLVWRFAIGLFNDFWAYHGTLTNAYALILGCALAAARLEGKALRMPSRSAELSLGGLILLSQWSLIGFGRDGTWDLGAVGVWLPPIAACLAAIIIWDLIYRIGASPFQVSTTGEYWAFIAGGVSSQRRNTD